MRMVGLVAFVAIAVLLLAFPDLWWQVCRADGGIIGCYLGEIWAASMLVVGTGWGLINAVGYLSSLLRRDTKASMASSSGGVWDRELDQDLQPDKCNA